MLADFNGKLLYDFIPTGSAIYKHYKINGIPIFLYFPLIKFARHLPIEQKYNPKIQQGKIILRKIAKRLSINHIDEKRGFSPSLLFDWNKHGKDISQSFLLNKNSRIYEEKLINYEWVIKSFEKIQNDGDIRYLNRLISVLALEIWYRVFITKDMKSTQRLT
jgi:asparagine synthase (glutamine-hydrolysing)